MVKSQLANWNQSNWIYGIQAFTDKVAMEAIDHHWNHQALKALISQEGKHHY